MNKSGEACGDSHAPAVAATAGGAGVYDMDEVSKHNTNCDCWVVVNGQVLNVTKFLPEHPGGEFAILAVAGKDASEEFNVIHPPDVIGKYAPDAVIGRLPRLRTSGSMGSGGGGKGRNAGELQAFLEGVDLVPDTAGLASLEADMEPTSDYINTIKELLEVARSRAKQAIKNVVKASRVKRQIEEHLARMLKKQRQA